jgi:hypothetical protein
MCFIAYGFKESTLEMTIIRKILETRGNEPVEAGGSIAPAQSAFCAKICSKIIMSQFCIVLLNNEMQGEIEVPNANVNMEYGLMLGFNKYIIPFQRDSQKLPFNVAGLDTIKYNNTDFERKATQAIDQAIKATEQEGSSINMSNQFIELFLLGRNVLFTPIDEPGMKNLFQMGAPLGFNLLNDFAAIRQFYFGNFSALSPEVALWRIRKLNSILNERVGSIPHRVKMGLIGEKDIDGFRELFKQMQIWVAVTSNRDREKLMAEFDKAPLDYHVEIFSFDDMLAEMKRLMPFSD